MEENETFDAGRGSFLTSDGGVQLDALLMDGGRMKAGGVACVERLRNPIRAARLVLEKSPHVYFVGVGAEAFAAEHGMELIANGELVLDRERRRLEAARVRVAAGLADATFSGDDKSPETAVLADSDGPTHVRAERPGFDSHDTVGAVALDAEGNLAAGTSTGGTLNKTPGRVGDSSLIGCGCYADNLSAAVSLTGWGEPIMKLVLGKWAVGPRGGGNGTGDCGAGSDCVPLPATGRAWRNDSARSGRALRPGAQHAGNGVGHSDDGWTRNGPEKLVFCLCSSHPNCAVILSVVWPISSAKRSRKICGCFSPIMPGTSET